MNNKPLFDSIKFPALKNRESEQGIGESSRNLPEQAKEKWRGMLASLRRVNPAVNELLVFSVAGRIFAYFLYVNRKYEVGYL